MRSSQMMDLILSFARMIPCSCSWHGRLSYQCKCAKAISDYDITYVVTDMESFKKDDKWLIILANGLLCKSLRL